MALAAEIARISCRSRGRADQVHVYHGRQLMDGAGLDNQAKPAKPGFPSRKQKIIGR